MTVATSRIPNLRSRGRPARRALFLLLVAFAMLLAACSQVEPYAPVDYRQAFELESFSTSAAWEAAEDGDASGGRSLVSAPADGVDNASIDALKIAFDVVSSGSYTAYLRAYVPQGVTSFVGLGIDARPADVTVWAFDRYVWVASAPVALLAGAHEVTLSAPPTGVRYDLVVVTSQELNAAELAEFVVAASPETGAPQEPNEDGPTDPTDEVEPGQPDEPTEPADPTDPEVPTEPEVPTDIDETAKPAGPGASGLPDDPFYGDVRAFPGAEGFGANASGGRGGELLFVTNLKDSGAGSARAAFEASGKRYIVPLVWGYVDLQSGIDVRSGNLTYAGQFMPDGQGLVFRNMRSKDWSGQIQASMYLRGADNAILRYLKVYRGINSGFEEGNGDGVTIYQTKDVILDRAAVAFGNDENINVQSGSTSNVTVQHSWVLNPLHISTHTKTLEDGVRHGAGLLVMLAKQVTLSHNFFYRTGMRAPLVKGEGVQDIVNNYDYNNGQPMNISASDTSASRQSRALRANVVGNLREAGPVEARDPKWFGMRIWRKFSTAAVPSAYLEGNISPARVNDSDRSVSGQWKGVFEGTEKPPIRLKGRADAPAVRTTDAWQAKEEILAFGGPSYVMRDGVLTDVRDSMLREAAEAARTGTGPGDFIDGWGRGKNWEWPAIPVGGISVESFWRDYFDPWRDALYPGAEWDDYVAGYQVIELFLNAWVPDFVALSQS